MGEHGLMLKGYMPFRGTQQNSSADLGSEVPAGPHRLPGFEHGSGDRRSWTSVESTLTTGYRA